MESRSATIEHMFQPVLDEVVTLCQISDGVLDLELLQIHIATIWGNTVLEPQRAGLEDVDLEILHDLLNRHLARWIGAQHGVADCFRFVISRAGDDALARYHVTPRHRQFLHHFARLILQNEYRPGV